MSLVDILSRMSARERTMLAALVLVGFMIWLSSLWRRWEAVSLLHRKAQLEMDQQAVWLDNADLFKQQLEATLAELDPDSTFDSAELVALIDSLAREGGVKHDLGASTTDTQELFLKHTLKVAIKNAPLERLIAFERALAGYYPYAALDDFSITANKSDPRLLNARMTVTAYELKSTGQEANVFNE